MSTPHARRLVQASVKLTTEQVRVLDELAEKQHSSRGAVLRFLLDALLQRADLESLSTLRMLDGS